jgi:tetratricopeptide (TPR) repeat protein
MTVESHHQPPRLDLARPVRGGAFVGRHREIDELQVALKDALSGQGHLVMLVGEPGIGKTRIAQEIAANAEEASAQPLWGRCYEGEGAPPYWPWVQILRSYIQQQDSDQLRSHMGAGAADIGKIIPQVREKLPGLEPPPALEPEQARFRLFDSITTFLKNTSQTQPLVLVLDDLHWADKPSLLLLQFLARNLAKSRLLVVGCYRDVKLSRQDPLSETLAELSREPAFQRVLLRGLSREDAASFIEVVAGIRPSQKLVETLYARTEGNPFFMSEVVRLLRGSGEQGNDAIHGLENLTIPEGVREVIGQRLNRLSDRCYQALTAAAVIGREFDFNLIRLLNKRTSEEQLLEVIDEALAAHVIQVVPGKGERYQFSHALVQQTLAEELSPSRRVRMHARIGEALEELYGVNAETHAAELAYHFTQAEPVLGGERLVRYSLLAGEQALAAYAWEEALGYFERGLAAKGVSQSGSDPAEDSETADLLFGLGRVQAATLERQQYGEAVPNLSRAFDYYAQVGDVPHAVAIAEYPLYPVVGRRIGVAELVARGLALVPVDSHEAGRLLCRYGLALDLEMRDYQRAQQAFSRALTIARREGDLELEMRTLAAATEVEFYHLRYPEALENSLRAIELARRFDNPHTEVAAHLPAARILDCTGDLAGARVQATAMLQAAERLHDRSWLAQALWINGTLCYREGDWQGAHNFFDQGLAVTPQQPQLLCTRAMLEYELGNRSQGDVHHEGLVQLMRRTPPGPSHEYT